MRKIIALLFLSINLYASTYAIVKGVRYTGNQWEALEGITFPQKATTACGDFSSYKNHSYTNHSDGYYNNVFCQDTCLSPNEIFNPKTCPPSDTLQAPSCLEPCPEGTQRQENGACCASPEGVFCEDDSGMTWSPDSDESAQYHWSGCKVPPLGECPQGEYRDGTSECAPIPTCEQSYQEFNTTSMQCEGTPPPEQPENHCTACEDMHSAKVTECFSFSAYLFGFSCLEDIVTCEIIEYESGECIDDDTNPNDPNYGDGSQNNNDTTNDIPDSNEENLTQETKDNGDGTSTTTYKQRNYDEAYETIGDNIEDSTKATNAQTQANKQNTEFLGDKLDAINDNLTFDGASASPFEIDEDAYQVDAASMSDYMTTALEPVMNYATEKIDAVWDTFQYKFKNTVLFPTGCQSVDTISVTIKGKEIILWSQELVSQITPIFRPIIIFIFTLWGLSAVFKEF